MNKQSLIALARTELESALAAASGRAAKTVYGGHEHHLRQTVISLKAGTGLDEHANPGEATLYVLSGRVRLSSGADSWEGMAGDLLVIPQAPHALTALENSSVLLTVAKS